MAPAWPAEVKDDWDTACDARYFQHAEQKMMGTLLAILDLLSTQNKKECAFASIS